MLAESKSIVTSATYPGAYRARTRDLAIRRSTMQRRCSFTASLRGLGSSTASFKRIRQGALNSLELEFVNF